MFYLSELLLSKYQLVTKGLKQTLVIEIFRHETRTRNGLLEKTFSSVMMEYHVFSGLCLPECLSLVLPVFV